VSSAYCVPAWRFKEIIAIATKNNVADLVVHIRYAVAYTASRDFSTRADSVLGRGFLATAAQAYAPWEKMIEKFPRLNHQLSEQAKREGLHLFDLMGKTGNLPVDRHSKIRLPTDEQSLKIMRLLPSGTPYITVHYGASPVMRSRSSNGIITKMLPLATWEKLVGLLREKGYTIVQLGTHAEELITGVSVDLRGKTTIQESAVVLKNALCHVDTEGGLVQIAQAMETTAIVLFGPTSRDFFGYPQNVNLVASDCLSCWWSTEDWYVNCPRGFKQPICMHDFRAEDISKAVVRTVEKYNAAAHGQ
jgi:ADP-heptose:LPS heptosyltransferase